MATVTINNQAFSVPQAVADEINRMRHKTQIVNNWINKVGFLVNGCSIEDEYYDLCSALYDADEKEDIVELGSLTNNEIFERLMQSSDIQSAIIDHWQGTTGKDWEADDIRNILFDKLNAVIDPQSARFAFVEQFFNQQMMFYVIGYKTTEDFDNAHGEIVTQDPIPFLHQAIEDKTIWQGIFDTYPYIKIRSSDGEFSYTMQSKEALQALSKYIKDRNIP